MSALFLDISMSLDGYVAGPNQSLEAPLGEGGEQLHDWAVATEAFHRIKQDSEGNARLSPKAFNALTFDEKFTYTMLHGEDFDQNCDASPGIVNEDSGTKETAWSKTPIRTAPRHIAHRSTQGSARPRTGGFGRAAIVASTVSPAMLGLSRKSSQLSSDPRWTNSRTVSLLAGLPFS